MLSAAGPGLNEQVEQWASRTPFHVVTTGESRKTAILLQISRLLAAASTQIGCTIEHLGTAVGCSGSGGTAAMRASAAGPMEARTREEAEQLSALYDALRDVVNAMIRWQVGQSEAGASQMIVATRP